MAFFLNLVLLHHGESADPELLSWIKDVLDHIFGTGPWLVIALLGSVICIMPLLVIVVYLTQRK
jgi:hypothetical protein